MAAAAGREAVAQRRRFFSRGYRRRVIFEAVGEPPLSSTAEPGDRELVIYSTRFRLYGFFVLLTSTSWVATYQRLVVPTIENGKESACTSRGGSSLAQSSRMLCIYFVWFVIFRLALFIPCVVRNVSVGVVDRGGAVNHRYIPHVLLRDMPLYLFIVGSLLFVYYLMQSENCHSSEELYDVLRLFASSNCFISPIIGCFAAWHNTILFAAAVRHAMNVDFTVAASSLSVPLSALETVKYHTDHFGDEAGKPYPSSCAICLATWEEEDVIKVTPCHHVFHKDCLKTWFRCSDTCAMCRYDLSHQAVTTESERIGAAQASESII